MLLYLFAAFLLQIVTICVSTFNSQNFMSNPPYYLPYNLWDVKFENLRKLSFLLFTSKLIRFWILHSDWVRLNLFISCFIMVCLPGKVIVIASQMFLLQSQLTFITKFHLTWNVSRTLFLSLQYHLLFLDHN